MAATLAVRAPAEIAPGHVYPLRGLQAFGISSTRMREGRRAGIHLRTFSVGRRKFFRGEWAIDYLEKLSALTAASDAAHSSGE
ncbi:MAG: hypothetical protein U0805_13525 [Pirellulales bacterium]